LGAIEGTEPSDMGRERTAAIPGGGTAITTSGRTRRVR
jgi:hypothetical protein